MKIIFKLCGLICFSFSMQAIANDKSVRECEKYYQFYNDNYLNLISKKSLSLEQRLDYLNKSTKFCSDLDPIIIAKAKVLFELHEYKEALAEIDRGIQLWPERKGNFLLSKVNFLYALKHYNVDISESYQDLINLLKVALKSGNENPHLVHKVWAEIAIQIGDETGDYKEAVEHVITGNNIKTIYRFYTLSSIISERLGEYEESVSFISDAVKKKGTEQYLNEADTVLSLAKSLCALDQKEKAMLVVEKAILVDDTQRHNPLIQKAANFVLNSCPNTGS